MRTLARLSALALLVVSFAVAAPASADTVGPTDFESFALGSPNGQFGWLKTGPFDVAVVANTYGYSSFGSQGLRISNAVTSGSFGDQTFSAPTVNEAGETTATNGGFSGGIRQRYFRADWDVASTVPGAEQTGLAVVASPDRGDGARMSWVQMTDTASGLAVNFYPYDVSIPGFPASPTSVASGLSRSVPHHISIEMEFVDGSNNDLVRVCVDGTTCVVGRSWEDYFRDNELPATSRTVDSVLFRTAGAAAPATAGNGFLIDNLTVQTGAMSVPQCTAVCYVDDANGNDGWDGATPLSAKKTIAAAVSAVQPGGQVIVAAGTYDEADTVIGINKSVTITGPNALISPNTGVRVAEAVITSAPTTPTVAFQMTGGPASVTFEGLTFDTPAGAMRDDWGDTITLRHNIFTSSVTTYDGMFFYGSNLTIDDNLFTDLDTPNADTVQVGASGPAGATVSITDNVWDTVTGSGGLNLSDATGTVTGNHFMDVEYYGILVADRSQNLTVQNNMFDGITNPAPTGSATWGAGVRFYAVVSSTGPVTVTRNVFTNSYLGVSVRVGSDLTSAVIHVNRNAFTGNTTGAFLNAGTGTLDGECNWYGSFSGPTNAGNPAGTGDAVTGDVDFVPWLIGSDLVNAPCTGQPGGPPGGGGGSLTVLRVGNGTGTVTSNPPGVNCPPDCGEQVTSASAVSVHPEGDGVFVLTAHPSSGSVFTGWSGGGCSGTGTCTVVVSGDVLVSAWFSTATAPGTGADVSASVTAPETGQVGTASTFSLGVANDGPQVATGVSVTGELPASSLIGTPSASQGTCQVLGTSFTCQIGSLAAGGSATISFSATPYRGGPAALSAQVSATQTDPDSTNNGATASTEVAVVCTITGTGHSDTLHGTSGIDVICGKAGPDTLKGMEGNDIVMGGAGDDVLRAGKGDDLVRGGPDDDSLKGGPDTDVCEGGVGENTFIACES